MENESHPNPMWNEYDELPEAIKAGVTYSDYQWMSDAQKANIQQTETEPEWDE